MLWHTDMIAQNGGFCKVLGNKFGNLNEMHSPLPVKSVVFEAAHRRSKKYAVEFMTSNCPLITVSLSPATSFWNSIAV